MDLLARNLLYLLHASARHGQMMPSSVQQWNWFDLRRAARLRAVKKIFFLPYFSMHPSFTMRASICRPQCYYRTNTRLVLAICLLYLIFLVHAFCGILLRASQTFRGCNIVLLFPQLSQNRLFLFHSPLVLFLFIS